MEKLMSDENFCYSLHFDQFAIDFDIKQLESIEFTRRFDWHGPDFVFAVAETWLRTEKARYLIEPAIRPGNLIEEFKSLAVELFHPSSIPNLENIIPCGGWCTWMRGYWERLMADSMLPDDDDIYSLLSPLLVMNSHEGNIVIYRYKGIPIIEIESLSEGCEGHIKVWTEFDAGKISHEVYKLRQAITTKLLTVLRTSKQ